MYGSSEVYRSRPGVLGRSAHGPAQMFLDAVPGKGLKQRNRRRKKNPVTSIH